MSQSKPAKVDLRHPIPDLQSLQGAYVGNIERLEEHAERMSEPGSDLGEEIRKSYADLKRSDSRRSVDDAARPFSSRSRNVSLSSHANSIVDVNGTARWGGYSPGGYITSPVGSLRSGSGPIPSTSIQRQRSGSKASRLAHMVHNEDEEADGYLKADPGSPQSLRSAPLALHNPDSPEPEEQRKVSSFTRIYDEIANELPDHLRNSIILGQPSDVEQRNPDQYNYQYHSHNDFPDRPATAASTDTTHQARTLWQDFDGSHCPDTVFEEEDMPPPPTASTRRSSNLSAMQRSSQHLPTLPMGVPPPDDSMVFYPAPVPKMLNLPKRLSQMPAVSVQARRRTQLLESMQLDNRKSAMLGDDMETPKPNRKSRQSMLGLPPQLRASAYFDQPAATQEFAVKGESAEDTLDSILNASARAPVSAFTDHPFAGHVGKEVYGPEHKRKSSKLPEIPPTLEQTKRRSSFNMLDTKRNSSGDPLNKLKKRNSSGDLNMLTVKENDSRMSLGDELSVHDENARGPHAEDELTPTRRLSVDEHGHHPDDHYDEEVVDEEEEEEEEPEEEEYFGAPTTLLAELQMRKAKQKTRNLNYATLVEQGMMTQHRTLLQMDDEAEKEKQKRLRKKVHLAWEAEAEDGDSEDDVPLGVLYNQAPAQKHNWDAPLGLIAQRELEDSEPLSRRRNRLRGDDPHKLTTKRSMQHLSPNLDVPRGPTPGASSDEDREGETLGERMRRLKEKQALESALGNDVRKSTVSGEFASEMFSKFGLPENGEEKKEDTAPPHPLPTPSPGIEEPEEETLGQRRARLQAEAALQGIAPPSGPRPALRSSLSLADVLSANPIDNTNSARKVSDEMLISNLPKGSLLHQNVVAEERRKVQRLTANMRTSSQGTLMRDVPATPEKDDDNVPLAAKIQAYKNKMAGLGPQPGMMGGADPRQSMMPPPQQGMLGMNNMGMMQQPMMGMNMPMNMNMGGMGGMNMGMMGMQNPNMMRNSSMGMGMNMPMMGNGMGMGMGGMGMNNGAMGMNMGMGMPMGGMGGMNGMGMNGMGMGGMQSPPMVMPPMDPRQREQIDRWISGLR